MPEFAAEKAGRRPITLRDLLTHTAGFDGPPPPAPQAASENTLAGRVPGYARLPLAWEPGSRFQYSPQTRFDILSRVVEIVSDQRFDRFLHARLFQELAQQQLKREVAISVTNFFAVTEMVAVTDYCATLPSLICRRLQQDHRLKFLPAPVDLGAFPVEMAWHVRYRQDAAHRWLRGLVAEIVRELSV
jgi:DNA-binding transcriptional LysR family regulator